MKTLKSPLIGYCFAHNEVGFRIIDKIDQDHYLVETAIDTLGLSKVCYIFHISELDEAALYSSVEELTRIDPTLV